MSSKTKMQKKNKAIFTIVPDRLCEDSSEECFGKDLLQDNKINLQSFEFPLNYELQEIHQHSEATQLSAYIKHLQNKVKSISNKLEFEYHQARETVLFVGQSTSLCKLVNRKKIDDEFHKMGIIRKYDPKLRQKDQYGLDEEEEELAKQAGDIAIDIIKKKIQVQWESQISDEMEKQRRRLRELQKKRQKQLEQIDKDFQKIMKKRKFNKEIQTQLKSQQSMRSLQNPDSSSNRTPKKVQKRQKIQRRAQSKYKQKNSVQSREKSVIGSEIESCSVMDIPVEQHSENNNGQLHESEENMKINLLQASNSHEWNHENIEKPNHIMESNQLQNHEESVNEL